MQRDRPVVEQQVPVVATGDAEAKRCIERGCALQIRARQDGHGAVECAAGIFVVSGE